MRNIYSDFIGRDVIARSRDAGVHFGALLEAEGQSVRLGSSRRLWYWHCKKGDFLSGVAVHGLKDDSKVGTEIDVILPEVCEVILCSAESAESIRGLEAHND